MIAPDCVRTRRGLPTPPLYHENLSYTLRAGTPADLGVRVDVLKTRTSEWPVTCPRPLTAALAWRHL